MFWPWIGSKKKDPQLNDSKNHVMGNIGDKHQLDGLEGLWPESNGA